MHDNLVRLRKLTADLPPLEDMISRREKGSVEYESHKGAVFGFRLYRDNLIAVQRTYMAQGCEFPRHVHPETEFCICVFGEITFTFDDGTEETLRAGQSLHIPSNEPHSARTAEETILIFATMPPSEGYP